MNENQTQYLSVVQEWSGWKAKTLFHKAYDELFQFIFYKAMNSYSTVFMKAVTAKALNFDNMRVQQIFNWEEVRDLSLKTLSVIWWNLIHICAHCCCCLFLSFWIEHFMCAVNSISEAIMSAFNPLQSFSEANDYGLRVMMSFNISSTQSFNVLNYSD